MCIPIARHGTACGGPAWKRQDGRTCLTPSRLVRGRTRTTAGRGSWRQKRTPRPDRAGRGRWRQNLRPRRRGTSAGCWAPLRSNRRPFLSVPYLIASLGAKTQRFTRGCCQSSVLVHQHVGRERDVDVRKRVPCCCSRQCAWSGRADMNMSTWFRRCNHDRASRIVSCRVCGTSACRRVVSTGIILFLDGWGGLAAFRCVVLLH